MFRLLMIVLLIASCQKQRPKPMGDVNQDVVNKANLYKSLHKGWAHDKCDSLGFTSLCKLSGGCQEADIMQAEGEPGRWYRSPEHDCFDKKESASDISKDMLTMLFPLLFSLGDKKNLEEIYNYGHEKGWVMGRGPYSSTMMTPAMITFLQELLGRFDVQMMATSEKIKKGYEKHLDAIHWLTSAMKRRGLTPQDYDQLRLYAEESPRNALFQALYHKFKDGDQTSTIAILLDEKLFPSDRLPTSSDRCEEYLWQRDDRPNDWEPCAQGKIHDGVDFLVAAWVAGQI